MFLENLRKVPGILKAAAVRDLAHGQTAVLEQTGRHIHPQGVQIVWKRNLELFLE